jgi:uncharacterized protein YyaL (SSP411 family)
MRNMTDKEGGFYSAEDADSEGVEGKFYVFTRDEIIAALGEKEGKIFADFYDITPNGNFEHGTSILNFIDQDLARHAEKLAITTAELVQLLEEGRKKLYSLREKRIHPYKDDKILTAWNALMIIAFAKAARILKQPDYAVIAERALAFIYAKLVREDGRLLARYRDGEAAYPAYLDDYAFLLWALLEVYETTFVPKYLVLARKIATDLKQLFWDEDQGGFFFYGADGEDLIARPKEIYDGAMPSGNSVAALALLKLADIIKDSDVAQMAERLLHSFTGEIEQSPRSYTYFLMAVDYYWSAHRQIVIAGQADSLDTRNMLRAIASRFLPDTVVALNDPQQRETIAAIMPHIVDQQPMNGQATAYICEKCSCQKPVVDLHEFDQIIAKIALIK